MVPSASPTTMSGPTDSIGAVAAAAGGARAIQAPMVRAMTGTVARAREKRMVVNFLWVKRWTCLEPCARGPGGSTDQSERPPGPADLANSLFLSGPRPGRSE